MSKQDLFKSQGFFFKENFLEENEKKELRSFFDDKFKNKKLKSNTIKFSFQELHNFFILDKLETKISNFMNHAIDYDFYLRNIWMIKTKNEDFRKNELPFIPHIDKKRYLKVFLYVDDVEENDGPFTVSLGQSPTENEKKRKKWIINDNGNKHGLLYKDETSQFKKLTFKAGTIICFDTNIPHFAGEVKYNGCRKVLRFNYFSTFSTNFDLFFAYKNMRNRISRLKNRIFNKN
tara:strand:- start:1272 stop:1970 length:699 start_codon:yes stop_codon:yes gene_type:complete